MSNPWFRLYSEFAHDPKVQMMSEVMQRRYIMILCMRCSNVLVTLQETEVAFHLRISNEELAETKALFIEKGFIDSRWNLMNWEKRQFASDTSKARVAKHRALQKEKQAIVSNANVTLLKRNDNALDTDTDTDKKNTEPVGFLKFWKTWPSTDRKQAKGKCLEAWKKAHGERDAAVILSHVEKLKSSNDWLKENGQYIPAPLVYLNGRKWDGAEVSTTPANNPFAGAI